MNEIEEIKETINYLKEKMILKADLDKIFPNGADLNNDGIVTKEESNVYDFAMDMVKKNNEFYEKATANAQNNAKWMALGSMIFLLLSVGLEILRALLLPL